MEKVLVLLKLSLIRNKLVQALSSISTCLNFKLIDQIFYELSCTCVQKERDAQRVEQQYSIVAVLYLQFCS